MISEDMEYVSISKEKLLEMEKRLWKLELLEAGGVDNWDGYEGSMEEYWAEEE